MQFVAVAVYNVHIFREVLKNLWIDCNSHKFTLEHFVHYIAKPHSLLSAAAPAFIIAAVNEAVKNVIKQCYGAW